MHDPEWCNLATVPSDGSSVLLLGRKNQIVFGRWHKGYGMCTPDLDNYVGLESEGRRFDAVAWAPIPKVPPPESRQLPEPLLSLMQKSLLVRTPEAASPDALEFRLSLVSHLTQGCVRYAPGDGGGSFATGHKNLEDLALRMNDALHRYKQDFRVWCSHIFIGSEQQQGTFLFPLPGDTKLVDGLSGVLLTIHKTADRPYWGAAPARVYLDGERPNPKYLLDSSCGSGDAVDSARKDLAAWLFVAYLHQGK